MASVSCACPYDKVRLGAAPVLAACCPCRRADHRQDPEFAPQSNWCRVVAGRCRSRRLLWPAWSTRAIRRPSTLSSPSSSTSCSTNRLERSAPSSRRSRRLPARSRCASRPRCSPPTTRRPRSRARFLLRHPKGTRRVYTADLTAWFAFCSRLGAEPLHAKLDHADGNALYLREAPVRNGRPLARSTVQRKLSAASSFYRYAVETRVLTESPEPAPAGSPGSLTKSSALSALWRDKGEDCHESDRCSGSDRPSEAARLPRGERRRPSTGVVRPGAGARDRSVGTLELRHRRSLHVRVGRSRAASTSVGR